MIQPTKQFKKVSKDFIHDALKICFQNKDLLKEDTEYFPEMQLGSYKKLIKKSVINYDYFIEELISEELEKLEMFQLLNSVLSERPIKNYYKNFYKQRKEEPPSDIQELTKELPKKFLIKYITQHNNFNYNEFVFSQIFKEFYNFLENFTRDEYITPLYNFEYKGEFRSIKFGQIILRPITAYELKIISKCDEYKRINPVDTELTHVLVTTSSSEDISQGFDNAKNEFQLFLDALTLNFKGDLQLAACFRNINYRWKSFEKNQITNVYPVKNKINFSEDDFHSFRVFYNTLKKSNIHEKENLFLMMAINRFRTGLNRISLEDKIIDFMTSLESLYASGPGDITRKLSQRGAMVLSKNEETREEIYNFLKGGYSFRSGLVHGEGQREVIINGAKFTLGKICSKLEDLTRESIVIYLKLIKYYSGKSKNKKIINDIDDSLVNRQKFTILKKKF